MAVQRVEGVALPREDGQPRVTATGGVVAQLTQIPFVGIAGAGNAKRILSTVKAAVSPATEDVGHIAVSVAGRLPSRGRAKAKAAWVSIADDKPKTGRELLESLEKMGFVGMWADRADIEDSSEYARQLREQAWTRDRDE